LNKYSSAAPHLNEFLVALGVPVPSASPDTLFRDDVFRNAVETLRTYLDSAERKASEYKAKLEIAEKNGRESERRRQETEKRYEELEARRCEEIKEQSEFKAKLAPILAQLQNFTDS